MTVNMILAPRASTDAAFRESNQSHRKTLAGLVAATICFALATSIAVNYFLASWALGIALVIYAVALLRWPALWLAVISAALPVLDLTPWTGWTQVGAPDLSLVTIGILALRAPPRRADFPLDGFPAVVLVLSLISYFLSVAHGFGLPGPEGGSDNPYLRPDTALRPAKGGFFGARAAASSRRENAYAPRRDGLVGCRDDSGTGPRRRGGRGRALCLHRSLRLHDRLPCRRKLLRHECWRWPFRCLHRNDSSLSARLPASATSAHPSCDVQHRGRRRLCPRHELCTRCLRRGIALDCHRRPRLGVGCTPSKHGNRPCSRPVRAPSADDRRHRGCCCLHGRAAASGGSRPCRSRGGPERWSRSARRQRGHRPFRHGARDLSAHRSLP